MMTAQLHSSQEWAVCTCARICTEYLASVSELSTVFWSGQNTHWLSALRKEERPGSSAGVQPHWVLRRPPAAPIIV